VEDDGRGFDVADSNGVGMGLSGLVARASQVGGRVQLDSTPGWGTRIRADLPYQTTLDDEVTPRHRVVVVHDTPTVRSGIVQLLHHSEPGVQVVAELSAAAEVPDAARLLHPDVVVAGSRVAMAGDG